MKFCDCRNNSTNLINSELLTKIANKFMLTPSILFGMIQFLLGYFQDSKHIKDFLFFTMKINGVD